jgi:serine phosphatase RsbU (regulator of sigma subunit)
LEALARAAEAAAGGGAAALQALADAAAVATGSDLAVIRTLVPEGRELAARAVAASSAALAAEVQGSRLACAHAPTEEVDDPDALSPALRSVAHRAGAAAVLALPILIDGRLRGSIELLRSGGAYTDGERQVARLAAAQLALAIRAERAAEVDGKPLLAGSALEVGADAASPAGSELRTAGGIARLAIEATGARAALLWAVEEGDEAPVLLAASGLSEGAPLDAANRAARALDAGEPAVLEHPPTTADAVVSVRLGEPPLGVLQLHFDPDDEALVPQLDALAALGAHAARALRAETQSRELQLELDRTRALLTVIGQAIAELSLAHTLETAVARVADLVGVEAVAVYLRDESRLAAAAARAVAGPHVAVAERLLELALGPFRVRGAVSIADATADRRLEQVRGAVGGAAIEAAHAVPLLAHGDVIGLLAVYPRQGRSLGSDEAALLAALGAQLAVAVQNARLHEETKQLGAERERALGAERVAARRLSALYEISRSFAQSLSLDATLDAVGRTLVELLDVDAAVIRVPDERGDALVAQAIHVAEQRLAPALRAVFSAPETVSRQPLRRLLREVGAIRLDIARATEFGGSYALLVPFLEKGSTVAMLPIATPSEVLATLTLVSFDPERPISDETIETALSVAAQAALAVDNARLYQQQKQFADTMQRSLLPRVRPQIAGLELGEAYESSARVDVGGDVYDFLVTGERRLAVVLGDVTGHGVDATADMAMAKFVFRSLARRHPEPGAFLAEANDVVVEEIEPGKFITMLYLTVDLDREEVACASAGHPAPRLVHADGTVEELRVHGVALGIEERQTYDELRCPLPRGSAVVVYTDGVVEARRDGRLYGHERLDKLVSERRDLPPRDLALAVLADCRRYAGGELRDDCAVVILKRT